MPKLSADSHPHKPMVCIGYIPIDENDEPYRSTISAAYSKGRGATRKNTMKMYPTEARAAAYSPVKKSVPVWAYSGEPTP